ncbi:MAG: hypothetical protein FJW14_09370 [Acidimicrobiia bacterium]|nr:hypothetical protein [Acidimicrobiia bacterium]
MTPIAPLARELARRNVRYLLIGVAGANLYAPRGQGAFATRDHDLFLPADADNLVAAWASCDALGLDLWSGDEPLDRPRDRWLAERFITRQALTRITGPGDLLVDLTLVMAGFDFQTVWSERREFQIDGVPVPTARLLHIIESKQVAGRDKDKLFLATHLDALRQLLTGPDAD